MEFNGFSYDRPPVLLIHGAFAGAWMWEGAFLDSMTKAGLSALAPDRGDANKLLSGNSLEASYQSIIIRAVERCLVPPILVTHSLGAPFGAETSRQDKNFGAGNAGASTA
jgi:pimeloyl-ACP methyl ester carboxylesterase